MPQTPDDHDRGTTEERINALYWHSDRSIGDLTDELSVGRNTIYSAVQPLAAGVSCVTCGDGLVFTNRTNRQNGLATCQACGGEREVSESQRTEREPASATAGGDGLMGRLDNGEDAPAWDRWRRDLAAVEPERYALVGGAAALGVMVGAAAARALRERL